MKKVLLVVSPTPPFIFYYNSPIMSIFLGAIWGATFLDFLCQISKITSLPHEQRAKIALNQRPAESTGPLLR